MKAIFVALAAVVALLFVSRVIPDSVPGAGVEPQAAAGFK